MTTIKTSWPDRRLFFRSGCPLCASNNFLEGPHGGLSVNFQCAKCGAEFNDVGPFGIELLSASNTRELT